ncbi:MAG: GntR family transcriptional regulator [Hyphomicrobiales bacterium]
MFHSKKDFVRQKLTDDIISGKFPPGTFLRQNDVAANFNLSSTPVREAFTELQSSGLLEHQAHRGYRVTPCDETRVRQAYGARRIVEAQTARLAAKNIDQEVISKLERLLEEKYKIWEAGDFLKMVELNMRFHLTIFECAQNPFLIEAVERLWNSLPRFVPWSAEGRISQSLEEHREMIAACKSGSGTRLVRAYETHMDNALAVFLSQLSQGFDEAAA